MTRDERQVRDAAICAAYEAGASIRQISERFGLTREGVRVVLLRCGHPLRSRSDGWQARLRADPEFARRHREGSSERMKALRADPTRNPLVTLTPEQRAVYDLLKRKGCSREEALVEARRVSEAAE